MAILPLHHVQLAMPEGRENDARAFYGGVLGMTEIPKPPHLARRGGVWFAGGSAEVHLGVEEGFRAAGFERIYVSDPFANRVELLQVDARAQENPRS